MPVAQHDPNAVLDYTWDFGGVAPGKTVPWLDDGDEIATATATVTDGDGLLTVDDVAVSVGDGTVARYVIVWLSGGTVNQYYNVTVHVVTDAGREDDRTIRFVCGQR
jgi:hypothetical protein